MRSDSTILIWTGLLGGLLGLAAVVAEVDGVAAILCGMVFALAALCLLTGMHFLNESPLARYRERQRVHPRDAGFE